MTMLSFEWYCISSTTAIAPSAASRSSSALPFKSLYAAMVVAASAAMASACHTVKFLNRKKLSAGIWEISKKFSNIFSGMQASMARGK